MSLESIFASYAERMPGVPIVSPADKEDTTKPPCITWDPKSASHMAPKGLGPMLTRQWTIRVEIWGEGLTETEQLTDRFLAATQDLLSRFSYGLGEEQWNTGGVSAKGCTCIMTMRLQTPVLKTFTPSVPIVANSDPGLHLVPTGVITQQG